MISSNNLSGITRVASTQVSSSPTKSIATTEVAAQQAEVITHFKDFRQVVEKSADQIQESRKQLENAVQELKRTADTAGRALGFRIDSAVSGAIVTVSNLETGQVIRQIPDEVVVRVAHSIEKMKGLLFDGKL